MDFRQYLWEMMRWWQAGGGYVLDQRLSSWPRARGAQEPGQGRLVATLCVCTGTVPQALQAHTLHQATLALLTL